MVPSRAITPYFPNKPGKDQPHTSWLIWIYIIFAGPSTNISIGYQIWILNLGTWGQSQLATAVSFLCCRVHCKYLAISTVQSVLQGGLVPNCYHHFIKVLIPISSPLMGNRPAPSTHHGSELASSSYFWFIQVLKKTDRSEKDKFVSLLSRDRFSVVRFWTKKIRLWRYFVRCRYSYNDGYCLVILQPCIIWYPTIC